MVSIAVSSAATAVEALAAVVKSPATVVTVVVVMVSVSPPFGPTWNTWAPALAPTMAVQNLQISGENQAAARGRIMDADFAAETANLSRAQILQQAGSAMVAQANQLPNQVLALLR